MKFIKTYDNFAPIKHNLEKPFKVDDNLDKSIRVLQDEIKSLRIRLEKPKHKRDVNKHSKLSNDKNKKIQKLKDLQFKKAKQQEYLRNNPPVVESVDNSKNLIQKIESGDIKSELDMIDILGLDEETYEIFFEYDWRTRKNVTDIDENGFSMYIEDTTLEELMETPEGIICELLSHEGYNNNEYYVDDDELNYLNFKGELGEKYLKLGKIFNYDLKMDKYGIEEGGVLELLNYLSLSSEIDDIKTEISMANEKAIDEAASDLITSLPFSISSAYSKKFNLKLDFEYEKIIEYIKKHNLDVKTIKEFIENLNESSDFRYEYEYEDKYEYLDYKDVYREAEDIVDNLLLSPDYVFPHMIKDNNLEAFKDNIKLANFSYNYSGFLNYNRYSCNLFELAKKVNFRDILDYLTSKEFEKFINTRESDEIEAYEEFILRDDVENFNI